MPANLFPLNKIKFSQQFISVISLIVINSHVHKFYTLCLLKREILLGKFVACKKAREKIEQYSQRKFYYSKQRI